jgi:formylglycine-generating enzyme required for sulfatase activity
MSSQAHSNIAFYCPVHQIRFHTVTGEVIECDRSPHAIGSGFPGHSPWTYCCDCATFSPYEPLNGNGRLKDCVVCERQITKRYLCNNCQVMSVESNALVRRKAHSIDKTAVQPNCPGCGAATGAISSEHKCEEIGTSFWTSRSSCLFCDLQLRSNTPIQMPEIQTAVEEDFDTTEDLDDTQSENAETDELILTTPPTILWEFTVPSEPRKGKTRWIVGAVVALLSLVILVIVVSTGRRVSEQVTDKPLQPSRPVYPGMVYVSGGEFTMGSDTGDEFERPAHKVRLAPFYIDMNEVTCEEYLKFTTEQHHRLPPNWTTGSFPSGAAKQPVTGVDWYDATAYAKWAGKRLPTEEEWEYTARGNNGGRYPWGNDWKPNVANAGDSSAKRLTDVGSYPGGKTATGVMDMMGNAWEWTASDVVAYPGGHFSSTVPRAMKVIRGGSWQESKQQATTTYRGFLEMSGAENYLATGFRCVRDTDRSRETSPMKSTSQ